MSEQKVPHRLKGERKAWGFTQDELATLLGCRSGNHISRVERAERWPNTHFLIASQILFGRSIEHLFKKVYDTVEEHVVREAYLFHERLAFNDSPNAKRKRDLLSQVIQAATDRHK